MSIRKIQFTIQSEYIKHAAADIGFADCGIAVAGALSEEEYPLEEWLSRGYNADMEYMARNADKRRDPRLLVPGARSVISLLVSYKPTRRMQGPPYIAQYAYGEDYHERLKRMLYSLMAVIKERYPEFEGRPFVDTAPISDRHWAVRAGLGWIGKNTLFVSPRYGSLLNIGEIVTTAQCDVYDEPYAGPDSCEGCSRCVDACPNHAIVGRDKATEPCDGVSRHLLRLPDGEKPQAAGIQSFMVNVARCTSYNTIENRDEALPEELNTRGYVYGCDICQMVCPYNMAAQPSLEVDEERLAALEQLAQADETAFKHFTKHSAMNRISYSQWQRNLDFIGHKSER